MRTLIATLVLAFLVACGGGSGGGGADTGGGDTGGGPPSGGPPTPNPGPAIALIFCSGHDGGLTPTYLDATAGPALEAALTVAGYTWQSFHFADGIGGGAVPGYLELVEVLESIRDDWILNRIDPTRVVVVAHSHGCVRAHAAFRAVADCPVRLCADLDGSSNGWGIVHASSENSTMGGSPVDAYDINLSVVCAAHPTVGNEPGTLYDLEDVVLPSVQEAFEVRSGDIVLNPLQLEPFDERWNARPDATTTGITCYFSNTLHGEVHLPATAGGTTLPQVEAWILARLASDP